jgi:hypothetical protein
MYADVPTKTTVIVGLQNGAGSFEGYTRLFLQVQISEVE